ncbi:MAG: SusD/RagB family nutrient-binding outer membrane lipoprotein [Salibacteraceae bacterium]
MKNSIIFSIGLAVSLTGCYENFTEKYNSNPKQPTVVPAGMLFANAQKEIAYYLASPNVNTNTFRLWAQHWTQTTYTDESNYELTERNINGRLFNTMYADVLRDLKEARHQIDMDDVTGDDDKAVQLAMIELMEVYAYHLLVDIFNDVPYSEALKLAENTAPAYDDASGIYDDLVSRIDQAVADLKTGGTASDMASYDLLYSGDKSAWIAFGQSLKLKLAMRVANADAAKGQQWAEAAAGEAISSAAQNASFPFESSVPNTNPLWEDLVQSGRTDFIASETFSTILNDRNDPRRSIFFRNLDSLGNVIGNPHGAGGSYANYSQPGDILEDPTLPSVLITYDEVLFLKADAAARGWSVGGTPESFYEEAIRENFAYWGAPDVDTYLLQPNVDYSAQVTGGKSVEEIIGTQKWIAMYNRGFEAWSTWRMYDYPMMAVAAEAGTTPPLRYNYSVDEYSVNGENVSAANGGSDDVMDPVFWDK